MNKLILPSNMLLKEEQTVSLTQVDLTKEDSSLLELLQQQIEAEDTLMQQTGPRWYRSGFGPKPTQGGAYISGTTLAPSNGPAPSGIVNTIQCTYDRVNWAGWQNQITLRLFITTPDNSTAWEAFLDVASGSATINAAGANVPADCRITLQMKVGNITGGLYQPPYISSYDCWVSYN
ncbi:hypothetical protein [Photorhabdus luminescens]|uniref:Uncharacterized protein n=2 Tax=Photorhabdus luminescens TaxID=29488 RepID=A0A5C4RLX3_PHOLU|nr:hypothetical protein [Photorhabdus luminescens]TDB47601.1 hypothetical protein C5468_18335 [Photorhabdus luminescens subsp. mexicana]TNH44759.1 hypothetical protein EP164_04530 [Photorhabdus luminescens subsp. sonorensis]